MVSVIASSEICGWFEPQSGYAMINLEIALVNLDVGFIVFCGDIVNPTTN